MPNPILNMTRRSSIPVDVGGITVGGGAPVVVQSMTNTDTADVESTVQQIAELAQAGSEIVRVTVDREEAAAAVPHIRDRLMLLGIEVPLVGDFHYIGHQLLTKFPECADYYILRDFFCADTGRLMAGNRLAPSSLSNVRKVT